jgi:hypothetical protein
MLPIGVCPGLSAGRGKRRLHSRHPAALLTVEEAWAGSVTVL